MACWQCKGQEPGKGGVPGKECARAQFVQATAAAALTVAGNWRFKLLVSLCFEMLASSCFLLLASLCLQLLKINPLKGSLAAVVLFLLPAVVGLGLQLICLIHMRVVIDLAETQSIGVAERTLHYPMALPSDFWLHQSVY